jgi:NitT/TauT family transport system ATP-binding protein
LAAGLFRPTDGKVLFKGRELVGVNPAVGYITQSPNLLPWRTVAGNVGIGLEVRRVPKSERERRIAETLRVVGLDGRQRLYPTQLSGGMQSRVSLARTLVRDPEVLLMDEPFAALDAQLRLRMQGELVRILGSRNQTILFVTHDIDEALILADNVAVFTAGPGGTVHLQRQVRTHRPRTVEGMRQDPNVTELWRELWEALAPTADAPTETQVGS